MRLGNLLGLLAAFAMACGDDAEDESNTSSDESRAVAEALTEGIEFENGLLRNGEIPEASATVMLSQDDDVLQLKPGDTSLMSLGVENPDSEDPVESVLLQFGEDDQHVEVPVDAADAGMGNQIQLMFGIDDAICDAFCNKIFTIEMIQAVMLSSGDVSRHLRRTFELDCRERGDADRCEDEDPEGDASVGRSGRGGSSGGGSGAGGSGTTTYGAELGAAIAPINRAACECAQPGSNMSNCADAPYPATAVMCLVQAVNGDAALHGPAGCVTSALMRMTSTCNCADTECYGDVIALAHESCMSNADFETALEDCEIATTPQAAMP
jgi:hypothetical protein